MQQTAEREYTHIGETRPIDNHDHDLVHELSKRLDSVWRIDQYIANAEDKPAIRDFWRRLKKDECRNVSQLKALIAEEVKVNCF